MGFMVFGNYNPGMTCNDTIAITFQSPDIPVNGTTIGNSSLSSWDISSCDAYVKCNDVIYDKASSTIVSEWDLACHKSWITSLMLSVQGGGFIIGSLVAGLLNNTFGRKPTHYASLLMLSITNVIAAFSVHWPMFTVMRFFIGMASGVLAIVTVIYSMEFVTGKWRAVVSALPFTNVGGLIFSLVSMALRDWRSLHLMTAVISMIFFLFVFCVPESVRWLATTGRTQKALNVVSKISKVNRKIPNSVEIIFEIARHGKKNDTISKTMTISDLYRRGFSQRTSVITFSATICFFCFTILRYDIKSLSGSFYQNVILLSIITTLTLPFLPLLTNSIGRKRSGVLLTGLMCVCSFGMFLLHLDGIGSSVLYTGPLNVVLYMLFMVLLDGQATVNILCSIEMFPTVLRSLMFSYMIFVSSLVSMLAAFLIPHDQLSSQIAHTIVFVLVSIAWVVLFFLPDTRGQEMYDALNSEEPEHQKEEDEG